MAEQDGEIAVAAGNGLYLGNGAVWRLASETRGLRLRTGVPYLLAYYTGRYDGLFVEELLDTTCGCTSK